MAWPAWWLNSAKSVCMKRALARTGGRKAVASGAGANSRIAIGTAVIGGMLTATVLAVLYIPLFFVMVRRVTRDGMSGFRKKYDAPSGEVQP